jgi:phosphoenolpyruvate---glycerone phosphotransferase subunit DhaL
MAINARAGARKAGNSTSAARSMRGARRAQSVPLADLFGSVTSNLESQRGYFNDLDRVGGNGNHGDNVVDNFRLITESLRRDHELEARDQLQRAADTLQHNGRGATANLYAEGLRDAARRVPAGNQIDLQSLMPLLQGLLTGVSQNTQAQPGQGTLLDALLPGIQSYLSARQAGQSNGQAMMNALGAALTGSRQVYQQPAMFGRSRQQPGQGWLDPGAASAVSVLEGLFRKAAELQD